MNPLELVKKAEMAHIMQAMKNAEYGTISRDYEGERRGQFEVMNKANMELLMGTMPMAGIMAGEKSLLASTKNLKEAKKMKKAKKSKEDTFRKTGWFKDVDGRWKHEIDDSASKVKNIKSGYGGDEFQLEHILDHPELYKHYPDMKKIPVKTSHGVNTASYQRAHIPPIASKYDKGEERIELGVMGPERNFRTTLLHEIQHAMQHREKFAKGANRKQYTRDWYKRHAGEVEARNVEMRANLSKQDRRHLHPSRTKDVKDEETLIDMTGFSIPVLISMMKKAIKGEQ
tara:strand:- start:39 stop:896 length:858 start_codon:yes stop_codon:yes gene_type:complete